MPIPRRALSPATPLLLAAAVLAALLLLPAATATAGSPKGSAVRGTAAPKLRASGGRLAWTRVGRVRRYVLAARRPGGRTAYRRVSGTAVTPPPVPGATMTYGLRTDVHGSRWAREVRVAYPAASGRPVALGPVSGAGPGSRADDPPAPPLAPDAPRAGGAPSGAFEVGLVSGSDLLGEARGTGALGARLVRVEAPVGAPVSQLRAVIAAHAENGTRVLLLAGFHGSMPTTAQARALGAWAREFGPGGEFWAGRGDGRLAVREIEFGNETSYGHQYGDDWDAPSYRARAETYARRLKDAHEAIRQANPGVGLLAQADDGNTGSANWVEGMFRAVGDLGDRVAGWTLHPYGPRQRWQPRFERLITQTRAAGGSASTPIWVTEYGLATDDGRCLSDNYGWEKCLSYAAAGTALRQSVTQMRTEYRGRLRAVLLYQGRDQRASGQSSDREHYFGALRANLGEKGGYTPVVRALLAGS